MLRKKDKSHIHFQRVAERDGETVEWEQIVKGYELADQGDRPRSTKKR